ncbi:ABC transporter permease [Enterococcus sp. AZ109]|uniref:ABC transporter permease n=1 Tax=Enterococcus sp. AZ109 TaxID=2774634 RepID=UPI003F231DEF
MLKAIYLERYQKPLIALCLVIIGICLLNAKSQSDFWHSMHSSYTEDEVIRQNYEDFPENYTYWDDASQSEKPYRSFQDYVDSNLYFYQPSLTYNSPKGIVSAAEYQQNEVYQVNSSDYSLLLLFLIPAAGFLLFFIDAKTGFNHFLFSLPVTRKKLFSKKLLYIGTPILLSVLIGQSLYALLIHSLIPAPYMNATLGQLFTSVFNYFFMLVLMFTASAFVGSMTGNLVFGPLTWGVFWLFMLGVPNTVYSILETLDLRANVLPNYKHNLFLGTVGKSGGYWWMSLLFGLLSALFLFWGYRKYQTISLENDGQYLLNKESRWPIWILMTSFCSVVLGTIIFSPWYTYYMNISVDSPTSMWQPIWESLLIIGIVGLISFVLIFFSDIKRKLHQRKTPIFNKQ